MNCGHRAVHSRQKSHFLLPFKLQITNRKKSKYLKNGVQSLKVWSYGKFSKDKIKNWRIFALCATYCSSSPAATPLFKEPFHVNHPFWGGIASAQNLGKCIILSSLFRPEIQIFLLYQFLSRKYLKIYIGCYTKVFQQSFSYLKINRNWDEPYFRFTHAMLQSRSSFT